LSTHCTQGISHICDHNPLTGVSSWSDIDNETNYYWFGDQKSKAVGCSCSLDGSCDYGYSINSTHKCNCDTHKMNATDAGVLSSTKKLPVMQLHYGGSVSKISRIIYQLDPLICWGKSKSYPSEATEHALNKLFNETTLIASKLNDLEDQFLASRNQSQEIIEVIKHLSYENLIENLSK